MQACEQEKHIAVNLTFGDEAYVHVVHKNTSPRGVQKDVCRMLHQRFPAKKAKLIANGTRFGDFTQLPFRFCKEGDIVIVLFSDTDDPYFYDLRDRRPGQYEGVSVSRVRSYICSHRSRLVEF